MFVSRIENDTAESRRGSNEREGGNVQRGNNRRPVCISLEKKTNLPPIQDIDALKERFAGSLRGIISHKLAVHCV